jgi:hypothetical protein
MLEYYKANALIYSKNKSDCFRKIVKAKFCTDISHLHTLYSKHFSDLQVWN